MKIIEKWVKKARDNDFHYILVVSTPYKNDSICPMYCQTFSELHENYHRIKDSKGMEDVASIIEVYHDDTYDVDLEIHNLL